MKLFSGSSNKPLAEKIARSLQIPLSPLEIFVFPDGERRVRVLDDVLEQDVTIIQSTAHPVDQNYFELFLIADALKRSGARRIFTIIPYLGYQRQDHVFRDGEAVSLEVIAKMLSAVSVDKIFSFDLHSVKMPEVFPMPLIHLSALSLFSDKIKQNNWDNEDSVLVSPDMGGIHRIKHLSEMLDSMPYVVVEKNRDLASGKIEAVGFSGKLAKRALIVDDMISSGLTMVKAADLLREHGVEEIIFFATHAIFSGEAPHILQESVASQVYITDSVFVEESIRFPQLSILSLAETIAQNLQKAE